MYLGDETPWAPSQALATGALRKTPENRRPGPPRGDGAWTPRRRRNARSHAAIARLGATFEGTLRRFRPAADGTIADVDYFSVVREEWPAVRTGLEARLAA